MKSKVLFILHLAPPVHGASMVGSYIQGSTLIKEIFETAFVNLSTANSLFDISKTSFKANDSFIDNTIELRSITQSYGMFVAGDMLVGQDRVDSIETQFRLSTVLVEHNNSILLKKDVQHFIN